MPVDIHGVRIDGARELRQLLKQTGDKDLPKGLAKANKAAAQTVAENAARRVPVRTGRTRASVRALGGQREGKVRGGTAAIVHYGWLDFGGRRRLRNGRKEAVPSRRVLPSGRYIYPALYETRDKVADTYEREVGALLAKIGRP